MKCFMGDFTNNVACFLKFTTNANALRVTVIDY